MHRCNEHIILSTELSLITLTLICPLFQMYSYCPLLSHMPGPPFHWRITHSIFLCIFPLKHIEMGGKGWFRTFRVSCWWVFGLLAGLEYYPNGCNYTRKYCSGFCLGNNCSASGSQQESMASLASLHFYLFVLLCAILLSWDLPNRPFLPYKTPVIKLPFPFPYLISFGMSEELFSRNILWSSWFCFVFLKNINV